MAKKPINTVNESSREHDKRADKERIWADLVAEFPELETAKEDERKRVVKGEMGTGIAPERRKQRDMFVADIVDFAIKDGVHGMTAPFFSLSKTPDKSIWRWESQDGKRKVEVVPSVLGRATIWDADILIYITSQIMEGINRGREDITRTVEFALYDYFMAVDKPGSGSDYKEVVNALQRLQGSIITTNIATGGKSQVRGFGFISEWKVTQEIPSEKKIITVSVTISEWLFNAIQSKEVLTINPDYFRMKGGVERAVYRFGRARCGHQGIFKIGIKKLYEQLGTRATWKEFSRALRQVVEKNSLPDFTLQMKDENLTFLSRNKKELLKALTGVKNNGR